MVNLIRRYWDIFSGTIFGLALSAIVSFKIEKIQLIYSVIILVLLCIGLFKVVKTSIEKSMKRKKIIIDKIVENQKPMKAIIMAQNPTKQGEELAEVLIDTMKGGKKIMKKIKNLFIWIAKYWQQIVGLLGAIAYEVLITIMLIYDKFGFVLNRLPQTFAWQLGSKIAIGVGSLIAVIFIVRNQVKWVGVGSLDTARKYLEELSNSKANKLSTTAKASLKKALKVCKNELSKYEKTLNSYKKDQSKIKTEISDLQELIKLGVGSNEELSTKTLMLGNTNEAINKLTSQIKALQEQVSKYESVL